MPEGADRAIPSRRPTLMSRLPWRQADFRVHPLPQQDTDTELRSLRGSIILALSTVVLEAPMVARVPFPAEAAARIPLLLAQARDARAYRRVLCIKLALDGRPAAEIARLLGWNPNSVQRVWGRYRAEGEVALLGRPCGGRHHAYLTPEE